MAGDWLKIEKDTPEKPEVFAMAARLGLDPDTVFAKCFKFWRWADTNTVDGKLPGVTPTVLDQLLLCPGFAEALCEVNWLTVSDGLICLPNFGRHNGATAKTRLKAAERMRRMRAQKGDGRVTPALRISRPLRRTVLERDGGRCVYCGFSPDEPAVPFGDYVGALLSIDHVVPATRGGDTTQENLVACCSVCGNIKNNRTPAEAGLVARFVTPECNAAVTEALPREEKRTEKKIEEKPPPPPAKPPEQRELLEDFDLTPEGLAQCWCFYSANRRLGVPRDLPQDVAAHFAELIRLGHPAEKLRTALLDPKRDRGEPLFRFRDRVTGAAKGPSKPPALNKTTDEIAAGAAARRREDEERSRKALAEREEAARLLRERLARGGRPAEDAPEAGEKGG